MNQRQLDLSNGEDQDDDITLEAEETEEDFTYSNNNTRTTAQRPQRQPQPTVVVAHGTGLTSASDEEDLSIDDEGGAAEEPGSDIGTLDEDDEYEDDDEEEEDYEEDEELTEGYLRELEAHDPDQAALLRFKLAYFREHGRYPSPETIMALDGSDDGVAVPINGGESPNSNSPHPHQQQQQHHQQQQQQQQQPGIVASQLAPGQEGDIVSLTASDGQVLTFSPGHQHYDQALQLHHNTQAAIQQQNMMQQQQEPPISVEDGEFGYLRHLSF